MQASIPWSPHHTTSQKKKQQTKPIRKTREVKRKKQLQASARAGKGPDHSLASL